MKIKPELHQSDKSEGNK